MSKIIKTKIDNVPVELEILKVGPASPDQIQRLGANLAKESSVGTTEASVRVVSIGSKEQPASEEDVARVKAHVKNPSTDLVVDLIESISNVEEGKEWYQSRTVWVNALAILAGIFAQFGMSFDIEPETAMTLYPLILGFINVVLRKMTKSPLKPSHFHHAPK